MPLILKSVRANQTRLRAFVDVESRVVRRIRFASVGLIVATALALTGCTSSTSSHSGPAVESITVSGSVGSAPIVDMPTPIIAETTECLAVEPGHGPALENGQMLTIDMSIFNGTTGKLIEESGYNGTDSVNVVYSENLLPGMRTALSCAREGSRIVAVIPPSEAFGAAGNAQWGITGNDSMVLVIDVKRAYLAAANGTPQLSQDGMPMVVLAPNGQPGVTVPHSAPPANERISVLKQGQGTRVQSGDAVTIHYTGVLWSDGTVFDSSWTKGTPAQFVVGDGKADQGEVIQGFSDAIIGQTVGSQVLAVIPPELAYGNQGSGQIPAGATLVFVIDILGVD